MSTRSAADLPSRKSKSFDLLIAGAAALGSFLLSAAVTVLTLQVTRPQSSLETAVRGEGRPVIALALALLAIPASAFSYHLIRLAAAIKARRVANSRPAGTPLNQVISSSVHERGKYLLLGIVAGGVLQLAIGFLALPSAHFSALRTPIITLTTIAALAVGALLAALIASRRGASYLLSPGTERRHREPTPFDLLLIVLGGGMIAAGFTFKGHFPGGPYAAGLSISFGALILVRGLVLAASWLIRLIARHFANRATTPQMRLAATNVEANTQGRTTGMPMMGFAVFMGAAIAAQQAAVVFRGNLTPSRSLTYLLVDVAVLLALLIGSGVLIVNQTEALVSQRTALTASEASDSPRAALGGILVRQALIIAIPACIVAVLAALAVMIPLLADLYVQPLNAGILILVRTVILTSLGALAVIVASQALKPIVRDALS
ncbi:hypothetical protein ACFY05_40470 [Microtetraspora fusca]|uniref:FtsX-like permease family protein n=1 Tax=Microtetraspora fusca TaxID=1997 RepID=A0ABW6VIR6_MICFU